MSKQKETSLVEKINAVLGLSDSQKVDVDKIVEVHESRMSVVRHDSTLSKREKRIQIHQEFEVMTKEIRPFLSLSQSARLDTFINPYNESRFFPDIGLNYQIFFPSGSSARSIFGNSVGSFGIALERDEAVIGRRTRIGFSLDDFAIEGNSNKLFVLAPQISFEYRMPIVDRIFAYGRVSGGPAYIDYSFNTSGQNHFGAKRLGADGALELGARWGQLKVGIDYRAFTEPAGLNFNGIQAFISWTPIRF